MRSKVAFNFLGKTMQALRFWFQEQNGKHLRSVLKACDLSKQNIKKHRIKKLIRQKKHAPKSFSIVCSFCGEEMKR